MARSERFHIDFDAWSRLASRNPEAFEARRARVLQAFINRYPLDQRQRLLGTQWRVDQVRRISRHPLGACVRISELMWKSFAGKQGLNEQLQRFRAGEPLETRSASVLALAEHRGFKGDRADS